MDIKSEHAMGSSLVEQDMHMSSEHHNTFSVKPDENANNAPIEIKQKSNESEMIVVDTNAQAAADKKEQE